MPVGDAVVLRICLALFSGHILALVFKVTCLRPNSPPLLCRTAEASAYPLACSGIARKDAATIGARPHAFQWARFFNLSAPNRCGTRGSCWFQRRLRAIRRRPHSDRSRRGRTARTTWLVRVATFPARRVEDLTCLTAGTALAHRSHALRTTPSIRIERSTLWIAAIPPGIQRSFLVSTTCEALHALSRGGWTATLTVTQLCPVVFFTTLGILDTLLRALFTAQTTTRFVKYMALALIGTAVAHLTLLGAAL